jgi:hypothetical protein
MQWFVNHAPHVIDDQIGLGPIDWRSPLRDDDYAEYPDAALLAFWDNAYGNRSKRSAHDASVRSTMRYATAIRV